MFIHHNHSLRAVPTFVWMPFALLSLFACIRSIRHVCPLYNFPSGEPPMYHCYTFWSSCIFVILHRLWLYKPASCFFQSIVLPEYNVRTYFIVSLWVFLYQIVVAVIKLLTFIYSIPFSFPIMMLVDLFVSYIYLTQPCLIVFQIIIVCYFLDGEITHLNVELAKELTKRDIITLHAKINTCFQTFQDLLKVYSVDIFVSLTFSSLGACVNLHSFINISTGFFWVPTLSFKFFSLKIVHYMGNITGILSFVYWLIVSAARLENKVNTVTIRTE